MAVMMGRPYAALREANVPEDKATSAAEEVAEFDNRINGLEAKIDRLDGRVDRLSDNVDAKFTLLSWMAGVNMALTVAVIGLVLRGQ